MLECSRFFVFGDAAPDYDILHWDVFGLFVCCVCLSWTMSFVVSVRLTLCLCSSLVVSFVELSPQLYTNHTESIKPLKTQ